MHSDSKLIIFTDRYPFGSSESFFQTELENISKAFSHLVIFPMDCSADISRKRTVPENVKIITPPFKNYKSKGALALYGIFNLSPLAPFVVEFFRSKCWKSISKFRNWIVHLFLTRALVKSFNKTFSDKKYEGYILYFYWGLRWSQILPFVNLTKTKVVVRFHGSDLYEERNQNYIPFRKEQLRKINLAVFVSDMGQKYLKERYKECVENTYVSRLGTTDYGLGPFFSSPTLRIVSCSNIIPLKQIHLLAEALKYIEGPLEWHHFGDGPLKNKILESVASLDKRKIVNFKGHVSREELMQFYQNNSVHVFVNVSLSEGVPISIMEALSFGIPVIATDVGGTAEIVDGNVGFLISTQISPSELSNKILDLASHKNYDQFRANARKRWEERCKAPELFSKFAELLKSI